MWCPVGVKVILLALGLSGCSLLSKAPLPLPIPGLGGAAGSSSGDAVEQDGEGVLVSGLDAGGDITINIYPPENVTELAGLSSPSEAPAALGDSLLEGICDQEGRNASPYDDGTGWHIGCGHFLNDEEIEDLGLADLEQAEGEARRLFGRLVDRLVPARRDALYLWCYSAACAGFVEAVAAVRAQDWETAALEILDSKFATDPAYPGRHLTAQRVAAWLREWGVFTMTMTAKLVNLGNRSSDTLVIEEYLANGSVQETRIARR